MAIKIISVKKVTKKMINEKLGETKDKIGCGKTYRVDEFNFLECNGIHICPECQSHVPPCTTQSQRTCLGENKDLSLVGGLIPSAGTFNLKSKIVKEIIEKASTPNYKSAMWIDRKKLEEVIDNKLKEFIRLLKGEKKKKVCFCERTNDPLSMLCHECKRDKSVLMDAIKSTKQRKLSHENMADIILDFVRGWQKETNRMDVEEIDKLSGKL